MKKRLDNITSNTLFHFTTKLDTVCKILESKKFIPFYSKEDLRPFIEKESRFQYAGIPMVCFCDIPLSLIRSHLSFYGKYGIGIKKSWATKYSISPVLYAMKSSSTAKKIRALRKVINKLKEDGLSTIDEKHILSLIAYAKPFTGKIFRDGSWRTKKLLNEEREWRYVPNYIDLDILDKEDIEDENYVNDWDDYVVSKYSIKFTPDDINYIIVHDEVDSIKIQELIYTMNLTENEKKILASKVLISKQFLKDI